LFIEKTLASLATDKIVVISRQQFQEIHEKFGVGCARQFNIIPLGVDLEPFSDWKSRQSILREVLLSDKRLSRGLIKPEAVKNFVEQHTTGKQDFTNQLWTLLMLELWFQRFID